MSVAEMETPCSEDVAAVVEQVWSSFLATEEPFAPTETAMVGAEDTWSAAVTLSGPSNRIVSVDLSVSSAASLTRHWLQVEDPSADDIADSVSELVNIIGGNIKSLYPGPSALSLPVATLGHLKYPSSATPEFQIHAPWSDQTVTVTVHSVPDPAGTPSSDSLRPSRRTS